MTKEQEDALLDEPQLAQGYADLKTAAIAENDKLRVEAEEWKIVAKQTAKDLSGRLNATSAELDAVRKERDDWKESSIRNLKERAKLSIQLTDHIPAVEQIAAANRRADAAQARCGALERLLSVVDTGAQPDINGMNWYDARSALLTPSQQPDNFDSSSTEGRAARNVTIPERDLATSAVEGVTHYPSENQASPAVNPSRPEPVKAGEWLPFDLAKALSGARVITRAGRLATDITKEKAGQWKIRGIVDGMPRRWNEQGRYYSCETDSRFDLFIAPPIAPEGKATEGEG